MRNKKMQKYMMIVMIVMVLAVTLGGFSVSRACGKGTDKMVTCVTVTSGDTLWGIAEQYYTEECGSVAEYVEEIRECNRLAGDEIRAGECLVVPYYP